MARPIRDSTLPLACGLPARQTCGDCGFAGERRRVICVKYGPTAINAKGPDDETVPNCRQHRCRRAAWWRGSRLCSRMAPGNCGDQSLPDRWPSMPPSSVKRGRELAAIGNCNNCHTVSGGRNFAGGLPVPTSVRHDLLLEHHAGCGDRNRAMVGSRVSARDALRRQS